MPTARMRGLMTKASAAGLGLVFLIALAVPAAAGAEERTETYRTGPIQVAGYQVKQDQTFGVPKPDVDGYITRMEVDLVDANGRQVPISRLMLHHIVFANAGANFGDKRDATCDTFTMLDSQTKLPALAERFYGAGEERAKLALPRGHGYETKKDDRWFMTWMVMNHRRTQDRAYIQWKVTYDTSPGLKPVKPVWLDVRNCLADPIYDVPGGGRPGSTHSRSMTWTAPEPGRLVAGGGHVHGGGKNLVISQPDCGDRRVATSEPLWGLPSHPFYNVRPILHEPGPINMSGFTTEQGFPVGAGQRVKLTSNYDAQRLHTRVMGIALVYFAPDPAALPCGPMPSDVTIHRSSAPGRRRPPLFRVPLTGIGDDGQARAISRPPGRTVRLRSGSRLRVADFFFRPANVSVAPGSTLRWSFAGTNLHNVTIADGPRGFSSPHLNGGREFRQRLRVPGTYRLFCGLHPVAMSQTITVERKRRR